MEVLFGNHISFILTLDTNTFMHIIASLESGLKGLDAGISSQVHYVNLLCILLFDFCLFRLQNKPSNCAYILCICCNYLQRYVMLKNSSLLKALADICLINSFLLVCVGY